MDNEYFASINEVSKRLSVPAHTLRYWEKQFPIIIRPTTGAGGRRYYRPETVERLIVIKDLLYARGMTIAGVKKLLRDGNFPDCVDNISFGAAPMVDPATTAPTMASLSDDAMSVADRAQIATAIDLLTRAREILES